MAAHDKTPGRIADALEDLAETQADVLTILRGHTLAVDELQRDVEELAQRVAGMEGDVEQARDLAAEGALTLHRATQPGATT